mmetsp:Transcript_8572/g.24122  ORF Transcript_8572/g.24122 Transcript_8572/m.24122 type:complete len:319 (+) Transcript_8572:300-1256(+)
MLDTSRNTWATVSLTRRSSAALRKPLPTSMMLAADTPRTSRSTKSDRSGQSDLSSCAASQAPVTLGGGGGTAAAGRPAVGHQAYCKVQQLREAVVGVADLIAVLPVRVNPVRGAARHKHGARLLHPARAVQAAHDLKNHAQLDFLPLPHHHRAARVVLVHHCPVLQVPQVVLQALDVRRGSVAELGARVHFELVLREELHGQVRALTPVEVHESVANVRVDLEIPWEVEEIEGLVAHNGAHLLDQLILRVLLWNVPYHHGGDALVRLGVLLRQVALAELLVPRAAGTHGFGRHEVAWARKAPAGKKRRKSRKELEGTA